MIKKITIVVLLVSVLFLLCGCNISSDNPLATSVNNTKAYIKVEEKTVVVDVKAYIINSANGVITVYGTDGTDYKTHSVNVVLIEDSEGQRSK